MAQMEFNSKQTQALDLDMHVSLTAGAGTGKTCVLVERYVRAIRQGRAGVDEILALTFTEKAAAEMKIRVSRAFAEIIEQATTEEEAREWEERLEQFRSPHISTFHSFCSGVLREFPIEAGVDPAFDVLDESRAVLLQGETVDLFLDGLDRDGDADLRLLSVMWYRARVREALLALLGKRHHAMQWAARAEEMAPDGMEQYVRSLCDAAVSGPAMREKCRALADQLDAFSCSDTGDRLHPMVEAAHAALVMIAKGETPDFGPLTDIKLNCGSKKNWDDLPAVKDTLKQCRELAGAAAQFQFTDKDRYASGAAVALARLFIGFVQDYDQRKGGGVVLDFDDLEQKTLALFHGDPQVRDVLRRRFRYILIDEFQDTNDIQWDIIRLLAADEGGGLLNSNTFVVGDEKQSIYAFRGANVAVFDRAREDIVNSNDAASVEASGRIEMDICYRSRPGLIRFFNDVFGAVFGITPPEEYLAPIQYFPINAERNDEAGESSLPVEFLVSDDPEPERKDGMASGRVDDATAVARRLRMLGEEGMPFSDMAILFDRRTHLKDYMEALRSQGVPFRTVGGFGFFGCAEVLDLVSIIKFLAHPGDNVSLLAALRSPFLGLSDEELLEVAGAQGRCLWRRLSTAATDASLPGTENITRVFTLLNQWLQAAGRMPLSVLFRGICRDTGFPGTLGMAEYPLQARGNIEKLIGMARMYEQQQDAGVHGFSEWLQTMIDSGARVPEAIVAGDDRDAVQLMTIHASKGLEFKVVVIPQMGDRKRRNYASTVLFDEIRAGRYEPGFTVPDPDNRYEIAPSAMRNMVKEVAGRKEQEELRRLFYVACTRARDKLILAGVRSGVLDAANELQDPSPEMWDELVVCALRNARAGRVPGDDVAVIPQNELPSGDVVAAREPQINAQKRVADLLQKKTHPEKEAPLLKWLAPLERDAGDAMAFSVREIMAYSDSPESYFRSHVLGVPLDWEAGAQQGVSQGVSPLVRGNIVHEIFEQLPHVTPGREPAALERMLEEHGVGDQNVVREFVAHYAPLVQRFRETPQGKAAAAPDAKRELPFVLQVDRWRVRGVVDLAYMNGDSCHVIDFKTDRIAGKQVAEKAKHYGMQLGLYAAALLQSSADIHSVSAQLYFVEPDRFSEPLEITREHVRDLLASIAPLLKGMEDLHRQSESGGMRGRQGVGQ